MTEELFNGTFIVTAYYSEKKGMCVQITDNDRISNTGFVQLDKDGVISLVNVLNEWLEVQE